MRGLAVSFVQRLRVVGPVVLLLSLVGVAGAEKPKVAPSQDLQALLLSIQSRYRQLGDMSADFEQVYVDSLIGKRPPESGKMWARPSGKLRWSYRLPAEKEFIFDGQSAWFYEPSNAQVTVFDDFDKTPLSVALRFFWGQGDIGKLFTIKACEKNCDVGEPGDTVIALWPKEQLSSVSHILLVIASPSTDGTRERVRMSVVIDALGNRTEYRFSAFTAEPGLTDTRFEFVIPAGISVLRSTVGK